MKIKWLTQIEPVEADTIPWFVDNIDADQIRDVLADSTVPFAISDHYGSIERTSVPILCIPTWLEFLTGFYSKQSHAPNFDQTNYCVNFTANKKQINRFVMIKLLGWFGIDSFDYTWSGAGDSANLSGMWQEFDQVDPDLKSYMCAPISNIEPRFFLPANSEVGHNRLQIRNTGHGKFSVLYWQEKFQQLYQHSAVSLIAEDIQFQQAALFTEKTLWAAMAQTFPIWIGGYNQARAWQQMGFDIFDDVIDHSYQNYQSLWQRCYYAFAKNLPILTDLEMARSLRNHYRSRLLANRDLIFSGQFGVHIQNTVGSQQSKYHNLLENAVKSYKQRMHEQASLC
jgi:hypothetical protein